MNLELIQEVKESVKGSFNFRDLAINHPRSLGREVLENAIKLGSAKSSEEKSYFEIKVTSISEGFITALYTKVRDGETVFESKLILCITAKSKNVLLACTDRYKLFLDLQA